MQLYRGDFSPDFKVKPWQKSRYGFFALFFTPDIALARMYARYPTIKSSPSHKGYLYMCNIADSLLIPNDFGGKPSHGPEFRNLIHTLKASISRQHGSVPWWTTPITPCPITRARTSLLSLTSR